MCNQSCLGNPIIPSTWKFEVKDILSTFINSSRAFASNFFFSFGNQNTKINWSEYSHLFSVNFLGRYSYHLYLSRSLTSIFCCSFCLISCISELCSGLWLTGSRAPSSGSEAHFSPLVLTS